MICKKKYLFSLTLIIFIGLNAFSQKINPDGYNKFYYPDGTLSSEGIFKNGKPVGCWKSYYPDGTLKSEGNRKNEKLDSVWRFFDRSGHLTEVIDYKNGIKSGYYKTYKFVKDSDYIGNVLISKELYVNGEKNGKSYYYTDRGKLEKTVEYEKNYKNGYEKHYDENGNIILILKYAYNNLLSSDRINRTDTKGRKQGIWKTFWGNEKLHTYANYLNDTLNGYYREYNPYGELIKEKFYLMGKETKLTKEEKEKSNIKIKKEYYPDGKLKKTGPYINNKPIGIHKVYDKTGKIVNAETYSDKGIKLGEGRIDKEGKKQGAWKFLYSDGKIRSEGNFVNGRKSGKWTYFYKSGNTEQKGNYKNGKPEGVWIWYYDNGNIRRKGKFNKGKEIGKFFELTEEGDTLSIGNYIYGLKSGEWKTSVNDYTETGKYISGKKEGEWKAFYPDGKLQFKGNYIENYPDGKHIYYYPSGKVKEIRYYAAGQKVKKWKKYTPEGDLNTIIEYKGGKIYKIDGQKVKN